MWGNISKRYLQTSFHAGPDGTLAFLVKLVSLVCRVLWWASHTYVPEAFYRQFQDTCHVLCVPQGKGMRGVIGRVASSSSLGCSHGLTGQLLVFSLNSSCCIFLSCSQVFRIPGSHDIAASPSYGSPPRVLLHFQELWFSCPLSLSCL